MAKKRKPTKDDLAKSLARLRGDVSGLVTLEKELDKVKANLAKFLDQVQEISGVEYLIERKKKIVRATRRR